MQRRARSPFDGEDEDSEEESSRDDEDPLIPLQAVQPARKEAAWTDPDDTKVQVSLSTHKRLRKLRETREDDQVGGREYERRLRKQYEKINPTPEWATKARKKLRPTKSKRRRSSLSSGDEGSSGEEVEEEDYSKLLTSSGGILGRTKSTALPQGTLSIERLRDANISARSEGAVKAAHFHPSLPVLLVTSEDRRLRLFNVSMCLVSRRS